MARGEGRIGGFQINVETPKINFRNELGRYESAQSEMYQQNRELAQVMQAQVGRVVENNLLRPNVSSGRLLRVTMDPKNRDFNYTYAAVGNIQWLDTGIAKYWRTIEEGSAVTWPSFLELPLQGLWGMNISKPWRVSATGSDWFGLGGKRVRGETDGKEMYQPFRKGRGGGPSPLPVFTPGKHIRPQNAYQYVGENPVYSRYMLANAVKFWNRILDDGIKPQNGPGASFRGGIYDHGIG